MPSISITVPASSANIGPGFDTLGLSLSLFLTVKATIPGANPNAITIEYTKQSESGKVPLSVAENLITRTAVYVAAANGRSLPRSMHVLVDNQIPLGRGLGSSAAAIVAGSCLGNSSAQLGLSRDRLLDYCLMIENHPDNLAAALVGGFITSFVREEVSDETTDAVERLATEIAKQEAEGPMTPNGIHKQLPTPPPGLGSFVNLPCSHRVKAVVVIPHFEVSTKLAREVLPKSYSRSDAVFNMQRVALLTTALAADHPDPNVVSVAMQDCLHQPYRTQLVPGLTQIMALKPSDLPGLLGTCLSGAGPTVLALATENVESIGKRIQSIFGEHIGPDGRPIQSMVKVLDIVHDGTVVKFT
ncbi:GHMP kinase [Cladochytrium replicatum]|nr:GHMP kinase [Cladochytrium replicatum]